MMKGIDNNFKFHIDKVEFEKTNGITEKWYETKERTVNGWRVRAMGHFMIQKVSKETILYLN